jgi:hypothetical protein
MVKSVNWDGAEVDIFVFDARLAAQQGHINKRTPAGLILDAPYSRGSFYLLTLGRTLFKIVNTIGIVK